MSAVASYPATSRERIPCGCGRDRFCLLCDDLGRRPIELADIEKLRRHCRHNGYRALERTCARAMADESDLLAWHACAEALR